MSIEKQKQQVLFLLCYLHLDGKGDNSMDNNISCQIQLYFFCLFLIDWEYL